MAKEAAGEPRTNGKEESAFPVFDPAEFTKLSNRNMEVATRAARAYFNGAARLNQEMIGFVNDRVKKDMETARALITSKSSSDAFAAQAAFFEHAIRDYANEASKVMHLAADIARETLTPVEEGAQEVMQSIDKKVEAQAAKAAE